MTIYAETFIETEYKNQHWFNVGAPDEWSKDQGATHTMETQDGTRAAIIKKTVAYIAVDEDENGGIVWDKWGIKRV